MQYAYSLVKLLRFQRCYGENNLLGCFLLPFFLIITWLLSGEDL